MLRNLSLTDTSGKKSVTVTAFVLGFLLINLKLLVSGMTLFGYQMTAFTGSEYSMALTALGGIYVLRRATTKPNSKETSDGNKEA